MMRVRSLTAGLLTAVMLCGCATHIRPYRQKVRKYKPEKYAASGDRRTEGSLWDESADTLFTMRRSHRVGDLVTVKIAETANATRGANTETSRKSSSAFGISAFVGAMAALKKAHSSIDPSKLISAMSESEFEGKGKTGRSGTLQATITTRIKNVLPNGDFYIEGGKVVMVNEEESHFYLSGVIRPSDVEADNSVISTLIADAQVEYTGRGPLADKQKPGWFTRFLDWMNPF